MMFTPFFRSIPESYIYLDLDFRILEVTDACLIPTKKKREEVIGKTLFDAFPTKTEDMLEMTDRLNKAIQEKKPQELPPHRFDLLINGQYQERHWKCVQIPVFGEHNQVIGLLCKTDDITELTLRKKDKSAEILDHLTEGFFSLDSDLRFTGANQVMLTFFRCTLKDLLGRHLDEFSPIKEDRERFRKHYYHVLKTGEPTHFVERYHEIVLDVSVYRTSHGELAIFYRDVSQARRNEERLTALTQELELAYKEADLARKHLSKLLQSAPVPIALMEGKDLIFTLANQQFHSALGFQSVLGKSFTEVTSGGQKTIEIMERVLRTGEAHEENEFQLNRMDGKTIYINFIAKPYLNPHDRVIGIMLVCYEVTEMVLSRKKMEEAVKLRDEFFSIASHELKTPLTSLQLQSEVASHILEACDLEGQLGRDLNWSLNVTRKGIERLSSLVDDMLDISRISHGKLSLNLEEISLNKIVSEVMERFVLQLKLKNIQFQIMEEEVVQGQWDPFRIEQVVVNLVSNAIKYAGSSPIKISISKKENVAILSLSDRGPGIPKEHQERIFRQFERIDNGQASGLGLGLYICREIVERHGGKIRLESSPHQGSTFTVTLPL